MMKELKNRIRENKYLTRNETDFIIKALEENSSLRKQVNMWQSEHAKRVLELGKLREDVKRAREEISKSCYKACITDDGDIKESKVLEILDKLIESEGVNDTQTNNVVMSHRV